MARLLSRLSEKKYLVSPLLEIVGVMNSPQRDEAMLRLQLLNLRGG
ncbi:hypothetical protein [Pseudomonas caspiana]